MHLSAAIVPLTVLGYLETGQGERDNRCAAQALSLVLVNGAQMLYKNTVTCAGLLNEHLDQATELFR